MKGLKVDLLFLCFTGIGIGEPTRDHSTFLKSSRRLLDGAVAARTLATKTLKIQPLRRPPRQD